MIEISPIRPHCVFDERKRDFFKEDKMKLNKWFIVLVITIVVSGLAHAEESFIKKGSNLSGAYMVSYPGIWAPIPIIGFGNEYFFNKTVSLNTDILFGESLVLAPSIEVAFHFYPWNRATAKLGSVELLAGGGIVGFITYEGGIYSTAFAGARVYLSKQIGLFARARYYFDSVDLEKLSGPVFNLGISIKLK